MKATVKRGALVRELHHIAKVAASESQIAIIQNVLIKADKLTLELSATDLEISIRGGCEADVERQGRACVPAKRLFDVVRSLPGDELSLEVDPAGESLRIHSGGSKFNLLGLRPEDFPSLPSVPSRGEIEIPASVLRTVLPRVSFAITQEDARYYLAGALLIIENGSVAAVSTDGHRMPYTRRANVSTVPPKITARYILPRLAVAEVERLLEGAETVLFWPPPDEGAGSFLFEIGGRFLGCKTIEGNFPAFEKVIGREHTTVAQVSREDLDAALRRVSLLSVGKSRAVKLTVTAGGVDLDVQSPDAGDAHETLPAEVTGPKVELGMNPTFILQFLATAITERVSICLTNAEGQVSFRPVGLPADEIHECVVMPMRF